MCGIVGYIGPRPAYPILMQGLKQLEYRGYDSAGVSLLNGQMTVFKKKGKVSDLENFIGDQGFTGYCRHGPHSAGRRMVNLMTSMPTHTSPTMGTSS
jgi:glucosamine 6-phosphate synthetase-like amidotransferase/phosphosugar isomerase protein